MYTGYFAQQLQKKILLKAFIMCFFVASVGSIQGEDTWNLPAGIVYGNH